MDKEMNLTGANAYAGDADAFAEDENADAMPEDFMTDSTAMSGLNEVPDDGEEMGDDVSETVIIIEEVMTAPVLIAVQDDSEQDADAAQQSNTTGQGVNTAAGKVKAMAQTVGGTVSRAVGASVETAKQAGSSAISAVRENPVPAAMVSLGLGWILWQQFKGNGNNRTTAKPHDEARTRAANGTDGQVLGAAGKAQNVAAQAVEAAENVVGQVAEKAQTVAGQVANAAKTAGEQVVHAGQWLGGQAIGKASQLPGQVRNGTKRAVSYVGQTVNEKPLAAGAVALGVGAGIGLALPRTQVESKLMGEAKDKLLEQVGSTVQGAVDKVQKIAE